MKFSKKTEGAISVFLVIILVPCLFISALFVDVGRVYLSKGMAYSAADLALNTTMTQYDGLLNEYYGLVASCQNMDQFYTESADFFLRTISSQNLEDDEVVTLANQYAELMNDDTIYDLLKTEAVDAIKIEPLAEANLANATMLKEQVVEFMKYRGPITVVTEVIDRLNAPSNNLNAVKDADENDEVVKEKEQYAEAEAELLSSAYKTYKYLYDNYSIGESGTSPTNDLLLTYISQMVGIRESYEEVHRLVISNLIGTEALTTFSRPIVTLNVNKYSYTESSIYSRKEQNPEDANSYVYIITGTDWTARLDDLEEAIAAFNTAKTNMTNKMNSVSHTSDTNQIQYWKAVSEAIASDENYAIKLTDAAENMVDLYEQCYAMADCQYENVTEEMQTRWVDLGSQVEGLCGKYLTAGKIDASDTYLVLVNRLESYSTSNINNIKSSALIVSSTGLSVDQTLYNNNISLDAIISKCDMYIGILDNVINGNSGLDIASILSLKDEAKEYNDEYNEYVDAVNDLTPEVYEGSFKESELQIIETDRNSYADINENSVKDFQKRLENIRSQFIAVKTAAEAMKYGMSALKDIENLNDIKDAAGTTISESRIGLTNTEINAYANETFAQLFVPTKESNQSIVVIDSSDLYNLTLIPPNSEGEDGRVRVPELYKYLHLKFKDANDDKVEEVEGEVDDAKSMQDENNSSDVAGLLFTEYPEAIEETITGVEGDVRGEPCSLLDGFGSFVSIVSNLTSGDYDAIRDELYIAIYMTQMFSYATYEREGMYHLYDALSAPDGDVTALTSSNFTTAYEKVSGDSEGNWQSTCTWDTYNKSLTNKLINATNNPAYRCEVEYILYGNKSHASNVATAFGNIFAIRAALNTVSVFQYFWSDMTINSIATLASGATMGVVPASVIKVVLLLVQSTLETCNDMSRLAAGWPVELYKAKDQWQKSLSVGGKSISEATSDLKNILGYNNNDAVGLFYSDYLTLFVCIGILNDDKSEDMVLRMGDVIQHNMKTVSGKEGYVLSNSITHFKFTGTLEVDPLLVNAPLFDEYNDSINTEISWGQYKLELIRGY